MIKAGSSSGAMVMKVSTLAVLLLPAVMAPASAFAPFSSSAQTSLLLSPLQARSKPRNKARSSSYLLQNNSTDAILARGFELSSNIDKKNEVKLLELEEKIRLLTATVEIERHKNEQEAVLKQQLEALLEKESLTIRQTRNRMLELEFESQLFQNKVVDLEATLSHKTSTAERLQARVNQLERDLLKQRSSYLKDQVANLRTRQQRIMEHAIPAVDHDQETTQYAASTARLEGLAETAEELVKKYDRERAELQLLRPATKSSIRRALHRHTGAIVAGLAGIIAGALYMNPMTHQQIAEVSTSFGIPGAIDFIWTNLRLGHVVSEFSKSLSSMDVNELVDQVKGQIINHATESRDYILEKAAISKNINDAKLSAFQEALPGHIEAAKNTILTQHRDFHTSLAGEALRTKALFDFKLQEFQESLPVQVAALKAALHTSGTDIQESLSREASAARDRIEVKYPLYRDRLSTFAAQSDVGRATLVAGMKAFQADSGAALSDMVGRGKDFYIELQETFPGRIDGAMAAGTAKGNQIQDSISKLSNHARETMDAKSEQILETFPGQLEAVENTVAKYRDQILAEANTVKEAFVQNTGGQGLDALKERIFGWPKEMQETFLNEIKAAQNAGTSFSDSQETFSKQFNDIVATLPRQISGVKETIGAQVDDITKQEPGSKSW